MGDLMSTCFQTHVHTEYSVVTETPTFLGKVAANLADKIVSNQKSVRVQNDDPYNDIIVILTGDKFTLVTLQANGKLDLANIGLDAGAQFGERSNAAPVTKTIIRPGCHDTCYFHGGQNLNNVSIGYIINGEPAMIFTDKPHDASCGMQYDYKIGSYIPGRPYLRFNDSAQTAMAMNEVLTDCTQQSVWQLTTDQNGQPVLHNTATGEVSYWEKTTDQYGQTCLRNVATNAVEYWENSTDQNGQPCLRNVATNETSYWAKTTDQNGQPCLSNVATNEISYWEKTTDQNGQPCFVNLATNETSYLEKTTDQNGQPCLRNLATNETSYFEYYTDGDGQGWSRNMITSEVTRVDPQ